ncbi:MAG: hypothetical protein M2R45_03587 [Verrucomicrobia subdivision 3 bacterium]|nr:hypothetical protein [Limisphaerales bacterium]MCS1414780.1 hypothetical protein [Limisphaerales bacterium]
MIRSEDDGATLGNLSPLTRPSSRAFWPSNSLTVIGPLWVNLGIKFELRPLPWPDRTSTYGFATSMGDGTNLVRI